VSREAVKRAGKQAPPRAARGDAARASRRSDADARRLAMRERYEKAGGSPRSGHATGVIGRRGRRAAVARQERYGEAA